MFEQLLQLFKQQQAIPYIMLALVGVGLVVVFERLIVMQFVYRINFKKFNQNVRKMLDAGDLERARAFCVATSKTGVPDITVKAIDAFQTDSFRVRNAVIEEVLDFMPRIRRRISQLPILASCAVFLGSLAAIEGVWNAFRTANVIDFSMRVGVLTNGLGESFVPLAFAIILAVILLLPYGVLDATANRLEAEIEHSLTIVLNILAPETATVISHSSTGGPMMPMAIADSGEPVASAAPPMEMAEASDTGGDQKGTYEEAIAAENSPVLDEEEII